MLKLVSVVVLLSLFLLFIVQNASTMAVNFFIWEWESSRALVLILVFLTGLATGVLLLLFFRRNKRKPITAPPIRYS